MNNIQETIQRNKTILITLTVIGIVAYLLINSPQESGPYYYTNSVTESVYYLSGGDLIEFYVDFLKTRYADYPWIIQFSDSLTLFSIFFTFTLLISISISMYKSKRFESYYAQLRNSYYDKLRDICTSQEGFTTNEIKAELNYITTRRLQEWEVRAWMKLFLNVRLSITENYSHTNMYEAIDAIDMRFYITQTFETMNSDKQFHLLQFLIVLRIFISNSHLLRLKSSNNESLRRLAYIYCMMANVDDPYSELLYSNNFSALSLWHRMELHAFFGFLKEEKRKMPSFRAILQNNENTVVDPFFLEEAAYWGDEEDIEHVQNYFNSPLAKSRMAAFNSMAICKHVPAEPALIKLYESQSEIIRRKILFSLLVINSGKAVGFFVDAYKESASDQTKRVALHCLIKYSDESLAAFNSLKMKAKSDELFNFEHAENRLINNHFYQQTQGYNIERK